MSFCNDLYNMEGEYRIMNSEIEAKTAEYLKKADEIVKNQEQSIDDFINDEISLDDNACGDSSNINEISLSLESSPLVSPRFIKLGCEETYRIRTLQTFIAEDKINSFTSTDRDIKKNKSMENQETFPGPKFNRELLVVNAFSTKLKALQEDSLKKNEKLKKKNIEIENLKRVNQRLQDDKTKLYSHINNLKGQTGKLEEKISNFSDKLQVKESECQALISENESFKRSARENKQKVSKVEVRLVRALEDVATLTEQLTVSKISKREVTETSKKKIDELTSDLEKLKRKNQNTITALAKQAQLLDNLKRQVAFLKTGKEVKTIDEKFDNLLTWNF